MIDARRRPSILGLAVLGLCFGAPGSALAQCSEGEVVATFLVSDVADPELASISVLHVAPVGAPTHPSIPDMQRSVEDLLPGSYWEHDGELGPFHLFYDRPTDDGNIAIVDGRDGAIVFGARFDWLAEGVVIQPTESTHSFVYDPQTLAPPPSTIEEPFWPDFFVDWWIHSHRAYLMVRSTDVASSLAACGPYWAMSVLFNSQVSMRESAYLTGVVILTGRIGLPWAEGMVSTESSSMGMLKARYR